MENELFKGIEYSFDILYTQEQVEEFAKVTGDFNPIHLDTEEARNSIFKRPIVHGFLAASVFSKVFGTINPGVGTIYLKQSLTFLKPMFVNRRYTALFKVTNLDEEKNRAEVETLVLDHNQEICISGQALLKLPV